MAKKQKPPKQPNKSFPAVLDALFGDEKIQVPLLYRLSDMSETDRGLFDQRWPALSDERRRMIIRHLADIAEENFLVDFSALFMLSLQDLYAPVRVAGLDGLWDSQDLKLVDTILAMVQFDEDEQVRTTAVATLSHYLLMAEWGQVPATITKKIVPILLDQYNHKGDSIAFKKATLETLGIVAEERVQNLIQSAYDSNNHDLQLSAIFAMGNSADRHWMPIVLDEMSSDDSEMRAEAIRAAGLIGSSDAFEKLEGLVYDQDDDVALAAVEALGLIGGEMAAEILQKVLENEELEHLHEAAEEVLEEMDWLSGEFPMLAYDPEEEPDEMFGEDTGED